MKTAARRPGTKKLRIIDLFAGVGGLTLGFIGHNKRQTEAFDIRGLVDVDREAAYSFKRNFPTIPYFTSDVRGLSANEVVAMASGRPDVLVGGPPCQGFSRLGRRILNDPRNELVRVFLSLVRKIEVPCFLLENVPHLKHGGLAEECVDLLKNEYRVEVVILRAEDYGVPQIRKRAFLIGIRKRLWGEKKLPSPLKTGSVEFVTAEDAIGDLPHLKAGEDKDPRPYESEPYTKYQHQRRASAQLLFNHVSRRHSARFLEKLSVIPDGGRNQDLPDDIRFSDTYFSQAYARLRADRPSYTITASFLNPGSGRFTHYRDRRSLTVREAARLQGFDDDFIFHGWNFAQARHIGNAVPPILAEAWAMEIASALQ